MVTEQPITNADRELAQVIMSWVRGYAVTLPYEGHFVTQAVADHRLAEREKLVNTPETADFMAGLSLEATHQRERWGADHDGGKTPEDWFWLIGYLAQKALRAQNAGDLTKAQHHTISTAAALANWHSSLTGADMSMRPGIDPTTLPESANSEATA